MRYLTGIIVTALGLAGCTGLSGAQDGYVQSVTAKECTADGGYAFALRGARYRGGCGPAQEADFLTGYVLGRRIYREREARRTAQSNYETALLKNGPRGQTNSYEAQYRVTRYEPRDGAADEDEYRLAQRRLAAAQQNLRAEEQRAEAALAGDAAPVMTGALASERAVLVSAHAFARDSAAIDHCTDQKPYGSPHCILRKDARIIDTKSGETCFEGAGELRFRQSEERKIDNTLSARADIYDVHDRSGGRHGAARSVALVSAPGAAPQVACAPAQLGR